jgi:hypothetical protein
MFLWSKARLVRKADNLTAIGEPIVYIMWDSQLSQPYRPPRPVRQIDLLNGDGDGYFMEILRIPQCLDNRLTDGGKFVSLTHQPHFTPQKHYYF